MGKTFLSLFSAFEADQLCQLYVYPSLPDVHACRSYYRITDEDVVKSLFRFSSPGKEVAPIEKKQNADARETVDVAAVVRRNRSKSRAISHLLRDLVWKLSRWYSKDVKAWLDREAPTCIFLAPGYAKFIYDMALKIASDRHIPIITYICDDYYFVRKPRKLLEKLKVGLLQKKTDTLMRHTKQLVAISEEIKQIYSEHFGVRADVVMTGATIPVAASPALKNEVTTISYFGNLSAHREASLAQIGKTLDTINASHNSCVRLNVYTNEHDPEVLRAFDGIESVRLCCFLSGEAFYRAFYASDMLLHVEAFDEDSMDLVKHSVSTKIADSLACGMPLLAYGPSELSSFKHLLRNDCAITVTNSSKLSETLEKVLFDVSSLRHIVENALGTARRYHDKTVSSEQLKNTVLKVQESSYD